MTDYTLALSEPEIARYQAMAARARVEEADAWRTAGIVPGARVADVGCGPGAALVVMAEVVTPAGSVTGVDGDESALAAARDMIARSGVTNATVRVGTADATGLQPGSFDVAVMRHVLAHNGGQEATLVRHLAELARPGGCVYLVDVELTGGRILGVEPSLEDMMARYVAFHQRRGNDPQVGLRLAKMLAAAGLEVIQHNGNYNIVQAPVGMRPPPWAAREAMIAEGVASAEEVAGGELRWSASTLRPSGRCSSFRHSLQSAAALPEVAGRLRRTAGDRVLAARACQRPSTPGEPGPGTRGSGRGARALALVRVVFTPHGWDDTPTGAPPTER